jgi:hypothetical protein
MLNSFFVAVRKKPEKINLKEERYIMTHDFSSWSVGSQGRTIMVEGHGRGKLLTLWQPGNRETD